MQTNIAFTPAEAALLRNLYRQLLRLAAPELVAGDTDKVRAYLRRAAATDALRRDVFGRHPIITDMQTAIIVATEIGLSRGSMLGVLLSDLVIGGAVTTDEVRANFGDDVARIVHGMTRINDLYQKNPVVESENFRQLLLSFAEDMRVILIAIASRVCVMRNIKDADNDEARRKVSTEAAYLYAPLAHKLGLYKLKSELEDLSLKYLEHDAYYHIKEKLNATKRSRDAYIERFIQPVSQRLEEAGLKFHIKGRTKSIHSIWQKMKKQHCPFEGVYDLFAIRVILDSAPEREKQDCWQVFSILTDMYQPNPKRMRDWLSIPKSNGYESLHITVLGPEQKWVEVQIRTERMDEVAERGLAAHWRYKGVKGGEAGVEQWLQSIRSALEAGDDLQLMDQFRMDLMEDEVFVFTPRGDLFKLPQGATVLDFAYAIHTKVGNTCTGGRIGGKMVTLRHKLQSGDQVEIMTHANQVPKQDWLAVAVTGRARSKIRQALKEQDARQAAFAKEELERKFRNRKLDIDEATLMHAMNRLGYKVVTQFYKALADGSLDMAQVMEAYTTQQRYDRGELAAQTLSANTYSLPTEAERTASRTSAHGDVLVIDQNLRGIDFQLARCCHPVYGDEVFGFLMAGGGIKVHRRDCPNAQRLRERYGYRIIDARWAGKGGTQYAITLRVVGNDDLGIVNNITSIISKDEKLLLRSISIDSHDGLFSGTLTVMLDDTSRLRGLMQKLEGVKGVKGVTRL
ncbi:MAG: bifunctional (p)ppGpp synthetase/guanosine-3',5'-bis(diphosphate) 3'-pyrophosphohydrolase [Bacteroidaceae bacterium]|nr:bifunctional (p)ppGpp synthetase/guanosine-3',5'-bis(diphosphate) 3'-pyrophosphohydrolase [Bacteroidaceae bacterium]